MTKQPSCNLLIQSSIPDSVANHIEAMAADKPVARLDSGRPAAHITRCRYSRSVFKPVGETGFLVRADETDRAASEVDQILASPAAFRDLQMRRGIGGRFCLHGHCLWERHSKSVWKRNNRFTIPSTLAEAA
jgi:hypothetical protein